jgi:hypothetical protein
MRRTAVRRGERRSGEIPVKAFAGATLEGKNPREHPALAVLIPHANARDSRLDRSPGAAACRAGLPPRRREQRQEETAGGPSVSETIRISSERGTLRRVNPMSAAGVKQNRHGADREETVKRVAKP